MAHVLESVQAGSIPFHHDLRAAPGFKLKIGFNLGKFSFNTFRIWLVVGNWSHIKLGDWYWILFCCVTPFVPLCRLVSSTWPKRESPEKSKPQLRSCSFKPAYEESLWRISSLMIDEGGGLSSLCMIPHLASGPDDLTQYLEVAGLTQTLCVLQGIFKRTWRALCLSTLFQNCSQIFSMVFYFSTRDSIP